MGLTSDEKKALKRLQQKAEEPDAPPTGKNLNISIDLGDDKQVEKAQRLGLLDFITGKDDDDGDDGDDDDDDKEEVPKRRGYFDGDK